MWKAIVAGTAVLAIAGTSFVFAQGRGGRPDDTQRWRPNTEDMRAFSEARLAALKAGLMLTPEQEKSWPAFEQAARELGKLRLDRMNAMRNTPPSNDPADRMRQRATAMADTGAALKKLADATDPLFKSLDESQKRRFAILGRLGGMDDQLRGHGPRWHRGEGPQWRDGDGPRHHFFGPRRTDMIEMEHPGGMRL
ncbi:MAG: Spy/CpxP family protein refolding chaperone [Hyphomicrobiales bacterium]|nr:Spy/CpxP family protein refolding chaperone [Hyphomicrobiales bacterium]